ncbi:MAG: tetratricopeptide repeat protein [Candidatus Zixiibacteriota bacterium]
MRQVAAIAIAALGVVLIGATPGSAQEVKSPFEGKQIIGFQPTSEDKVTLARKLIGAQRFQEAADLLEGQYQSQPDNELLLNLLRTCFEQLKQYEKVELLVRRLAESQPDNYSHRLYLAELLVRMNRYQDALVEYERVDQLLEKAGPAGTIVLIRSLINGGLDSAAFVRLERARAESGDPSLFALERGSLFERRQRYREAVQEYLPVLVREDSPDSDQAERRLLALLDFETSSRPVENILRSVADSAAGVRIMRLLADHYLKAGRYDEAFSYSLRQDSLEGGSGITLMTFARQCQERRIWPQAVRMTEIILQRHPEERFTAEASFTCARALAELGRIDEAAQVYTQLATQAPDSQTRGDAVYGLGVLSSEFLHNYDQALIYYDSVVNFYPRGRGLLMASKAAPLCHLRMGRLSEARNLLANLMQQRLPDQIREEVTYLTGLVEYFDKKYDTAETIFRKLMVDFPGGFYVNDALGLVLALGEAGGAGTALDDLSGAMFALFRRDPDSARQRFQAIADYQPPLLGDLALYQLVELELQTADSTAALGAIDRLDKEHPDSYYRPLGLKLKADILVASGRDLKQGMELYRYLLENCSEYPFVREVREKLRELDSRLPVG